MVTSVTARPRRHAADPPATRRVLRRRARPLALVAAATLLAAACGSSPPSPSPTTAPTPIVTPNPHLGNPATAQEVFNGLGRAGLSITPNTATTGAQDSDVVTKIFATYLGWPLDVVQYRTSGALTKATPWTAGEGPGRGESAVTLVGSNILVSWGPRTPGVKPERPDDRQADGLEKLVGALDLLLWPLRARANVPVAVAPTVAAAPASPAPRATPKP